MRFGVYLAKRDWSFRAQQPQAPPPRCNASPIDCSRGVRVMRRDPARQAPFGGAPTTVQTAVSFIMLSGILVLANSIALGVRLGAWKYLIAAFWYLVFVFWIIDQLIKLKRWAWWLTVVLSALFSTRTVITVVAKLIIRAKETDLDFQSIAFQLLCGAALWAVFGELILHSSRQAFGILTWNRPTVQLASPLKLDQIAIGVTDKDLGQSRASFPEPDTGPL